MPGEAQNQSIKKLVVKKKGLITETKVKRIWV